MPQTTNQPPSDDLTSCTLELMVEAIQILLRLKESREFKTVLGVQPTSPRRLNVRTKKKKERKETNKHKIKNDPFEFLPKRCRNHLPPQNSHPTMTHQNSY